MLSKINLRTSFHGGWLPPMYPILHSQIALGVVNGAFHCPFKISLSSCAFKRSWKSSFSQVQYIHVSISPVI